jgi:hypothetical protein
MPSSVVNVGTLRVAASNTPAHWQNDVRIVFSPFTNAQLFVFVYARVTTRWMNFTPLEKALLKPYDV